MYQLELFEDTSGNQKETTGFYLPDSSESADSMGTGKSEMPPGLARLYELSVDAFYAALYADMSELPIKEEISRFIENVCKAADGTATGGTTGGSPEARAAAGRAAFDRGDPDALVVLKAAYKVQHEIHRLAGFLRFSPDDHGFYVARCSPDHFILPALAEHFTLRFGETPWAIVDEKRGLCLSREKDGKARLSRIEIGSALVPDLPMAEDGAGVFKAPLDPWEDLWRLYHRSVNNESRKNPGLQRQFMPERYHKYLTELNWDC